MRCPECGAYHSGVFCFEGVNEDGSFSPIAVVCEDCGGLIAEFNWGKKEWEEK